MSNLEFKLEEQLTDQRSSQVAYKLTLRNTGNVPIRIYSLNPRVPLGGELVEITDRTLAEASEQRVELLDHLNKLLASMLWVKSKAFRDAWVEKQRDAYKEILSLTGLGKAYYLIIKMGPKEWQAYMRREFRVITYRISSGSDARDALNRWMSDSENSELIVNLFKAKTEQLENIESLMNDSDKSSLTSIEPASEFTTTYVLRFKRAALEPLKYQLGFDTNYSEIDKDKARTGSVATNILISPYPLYLSLVSVASGALGALLALAGQDEPTSSIELIDLIGKNATDIIVSAILALVFFNV